MRLRHLIALGCAAAIGFAAAAEAQDPRMTPIPVPAQADAIVLGTGPLPGATASESWYHQYGKDFARNVTLFMERLAPTMFTSKTGEKNRKKKIFVDYLRNGFGASAVAAFSPRWRPGAGVSMPVTWDEIDADIRGAHFNLRNVPERVAQQRKDPWQGYWDAKQVLTKAIIKDMASK